MGLINRYRQCFLFFFRERVKYVISHQAAFIVLEFQVPEVQSNTQRYSWNGVIQRFERGPRQVEEAARWTDAGRMLEIVGRDWDPTVSEERSEYRFTYVMDGDQLTFVQESESGTTVWRFSRQRFSPRGLLRQRLPRRPR